MRDGHLNKCRSCANAYYREYYKNADKAHSRARRAAWVARNRDSHRAYQREFQRARRAEASKIITAAKDVPCVDCGVKYPTAAMDFDHVRGEKKFNIGTRNGVSSLDSLRAEIAKCDVRCAVCHRLRHNPCRS